ncbi:hypothetical protein DFJ73DRAFT_627285 [Zopfochytrium polystomum]|nr:hypothetical protein DFJ73DRAFT_627285 [Zopfochytrium polystomum]
MSSTNTTNGNNKPPVLVTGGSGYVGGHVVDQLLRAGYPVRTTLRASALANPARTGPLRRLADAVPGSQLELFEADLTKDDGAFDRAMAGCAIVFHVASPFLMPEQIKDARTQVYEPAIKGTELVLAAVNRTPSVSRVVLTSTVGAIFGDYVDVAEKMRDNTLSEDFFNTTSTLENNPYHFAKTEAEKLAWDTVAKQSRWSLVTINPGLVLGPPAALDAPPSDSGSLLLAREILGGTFFYGAPNFSFTFVDVRDVALAHVRAAELPAAAAGRRFILARPEMVSFQDMAVAVRARYPWRLWIPRHQVPDAAVRALGPFFGLTQDYIKKHLGVTFKVDNRRSVEELGIRYRDVSETVLDHYEALTQAGRAKK